MPFFGVPIRNGLPIGLGSVAGFGVQQFDPSQLFEGGTVAGAWYDPSDLSTLFDSSTGTTPVSMPGLGAPVPVGLMLDKSQNGVGTNGAKRVNLLRWSEVFDATASGSAWINSGVTVTDGVLAPNGTNTADTITGTTGTYPHVRQAITLSAAGTYKASCYFQKTSGATRFPSIELNFAPGNAWVILNTDTGVATNGQGTPTNISVSDAGGYWLVSFDVAVNITSATFYIYPASSSNGTSFAPNLTGSCVAWGADLRLASETNTAPTYQRITDTWYSTMAGNHAIAFNNTTARPELRARVNLLTYSEEFDNGAWSKNNASITNNAAVAPNGTTTADKLVENTANAEHLVFQTCASGSYVVSVFAKAAERSWLRIADTSGQRVWYDLSNGTLGTVSGASSPSISDAGNGWYRCAYVTTTVTNVSFLVANGNGVNNYTGDGTSGIYIWGADLRPANIGANVPAYQRIADANTYDTSGFPLYLRFDGIDDSMYTPANLNLSGTDKVAVFAGVRKNADVSIVAELSANASSNNGAFLLATGGWATENGTYVRSSRGTATSFAQPATNSYPSPQTNVLTGTSDIAGDSVVLRINGTQVATSATDQGSGNYGTYPLYIGARNNSSLWFNGQVYGLLVVGSAVSAGNISATEQWVAGKTGIVIP